MHLKREGDIIRREWMFRKGGTDVARGEMALKVSYKKLWKLLIDKDMNKADLQQLSGISWTSVTKMSKGKPVSMDVFGQLASQLISS